MSLIIEFAEKEQDIPENEDYWKEFRKLTKKGFSNASAVIIGDLHAQMCMLLSHKQMQLALREVSLDKSKVVKELQYAIIFHRVSVSGEAKTDKSKENITLVNDDYNETLIKWLDNKEKFTIIRGEVMALETACSALSRELSRRLKE